LLGEAEALDATAAVDAQQRRSRGCRHIRLLDGVAGDLAAIGTEEAQAVDAGLDEGLFGAAVDHGRRDQRAHVDDARRLRRGPGLRDLDRGPVGDLIAEARAGRCRPAATALHRIGARRRRRRRRRRRGDGLGGGVARGHGQDRHGGVAQQQEAEGGERRERGGKGEDRALCDACHAQGSDAGKPPVRASR